MMAILTGVVLLVALGAIAQKGDSIFAALNSGASITTNPDEIAVDAGDTYLIDVLANDESEAAIDPAALEVLSGPSCGETEIIDGKLAYTVGDECEGSQTVTYCVREGDYCSRGTLVATVIPKIEPYGTSATPVVRMTAPQLPTSGDEPVAVAKVDEAPSNDGKNADEVVISSLATPQAIIRPRAEAKNDSVTVDQSNARADVPTKDGELAPEPRLAELDDDFRSGLNAPQLVAPRPIGTLDADAPAGFDGEAYVGAASDSEVATNHTAVMTAPTAPTRVAMPSSQGVDMSSDEPQPLSAALLKVRGSIGERPQAPRAEGVPVMPQALSRNTVTVDTDTFEGPHGAPVAVGNVRSSLNLDMQTARTEDPLHIEPLRPIAKSADSGGPDFDETADDEIEIARLTLDDDEIAPVRSDLEIARITSLPSQAENVREHLPGSLAAISGSVYKPSPIRLSRAMNNLRGIPPVADSGVEIASLRAAGQATLSIDSEVTFYTDGTDPEGPPLIADLAPLNRFDALDLDVLSLRRSEGPSGVDTLAAVRATAPKRTLVRDAEADEAKSVASAETEVRTVSAGTSCGVEAIAQSNPGAMLRVDAESACRAGEVAIIDMSGLRFAAQFDDKGRLSVDLPAFSKDARMDLVTADGTRAKLRARVNDADRVSRVALAWSNDVELHLHAFEFGATADDKGHVFAAEKQDERGFRKGETGRMDRYNAINGEGDRIEVYTFAGGRRAVQGKVNLAVEFADRGQKAAAPYCGDHALAAPAFWSLRMERGRSEAPRRHVINPLACGESSTGAAAYLSGLVRDLVIVQR